MDSACKAAVAHSIRPPTAVFSGSGARLHEQAEIAWQSRTRARGKKPRPQPTWSTWSVAHPRAGKEADETLPLWKNCDGEADEISVASLSDEDCRPVPRYRRTGGAELGTPRHLPGRPPAPPIRAASQAVAHVRDGPASQEIAAKRRDPPTPELAPSPGSGRATSRPDHQPYPPTH